MSETIKWREPRREVKRPVEYDDFLHVADVTSLTIGDLKIPRCEYRGGVSHMTRLPYRQKEGSS